MMTNRFPEGHESEAECAIEQWKLEQQPAASPLNFDEVLRSLDSLVALSVAQAMPLRKRKGERDSAFVKRIVAAYLVLESKLIAAERERPLVRNERRIVRPALKEGE